MNDIAFNLDPLAFNLEWEIAAYIVQHINPGLADVTCGLLILLNIRAELKSKCRHRNKFTLVKVNK